MLVEKKLKRQQYCWCLCFQDLLIIPVFFQDILSDWTSALASDTVLCGDLLLITPAFHMIIPPPFCRIIVEVFWCKSCYGREWRMNERVYIYFCYSQQKLCLMQHCGVYWCVCRAPQCYILHRCIIVQKLCCGGLCVSAAVFVSPLWQ